MIYQNEKLKEISFPLGGIGTGSIGLAGNGGLVDWEIFNRPNKGGYNRHSGFVIKAEYPDGRVVAKVLQGDLQTEFTGKYGRGMYAGFGHGPERATMSGFPHFKKVSFCGEFPIATLTFEDDLFPGTVILKAFNPFIPLNADDSGIPAAFFDLTVKSKEENIKYTVILSVGNPFKQGINERVPSEEYTAVTLKNAGCTQDNEHYGDLTLAVDKTDAIYQEYWYRGRWEDKKISFWHEFKTGELENRKYDNASDDDVCSVGSSCVLNAEQAEHFRFLVSWNMPNNYNYWDPYKDEKGNHITWKNYYATLFEDSVASCFYCLDHWERLYKKTDRFRKSLHNSTVDPAVIDAVSSTISVLKSPTVLRLEDGTFYGWEGVHEKEGACEGTCTHVWSYAYALCFLFPELERSIRDTEFKYDTDEDGAIMFRTLLPLGRPRWSHIPCVDGQMATVFKIYRDWKITGNTQWLKDNWPNVKRILAYAWSENNACEWDLDHDGVMEGRQHHTLDMELFGPSSWLQGMYLAALKAAAEMAEFLDDPQAATEYKALYLSGYEWTKENLFNGNYFIHKVDLQRKAYTEHFECPNAWNEERQELKYQIADGCSIDQMLGQWHATISGLGDIFDKEQRQIALQNMFRNNFKQSFREFENPWRMYALNDESGSIICAFPDEIQKPVIPPPYSEECMTGFEYAFAGLLVSEGLVEQGLRVVRAVRDRFDGEKRNPWNEFECGSNYARAMASFALLPIFSGFEFDLPKNYMGFSPVVEGDFRCVWSLGTGWGDFIRGKHQSSIVLHDGRVTLSCVKLGDISDVQKVTVDGKEVPFEQEGDVITFDTLQVEDKIVFTL